MGSGTVARTQRMPIEQRAESAVIAWLRHQTTAYQIEPNLTTDEFIDVLVRNIGGATARWLYGYRQG